MKHVFAFLLVLFSFSLYGQYYPQLIRTQPAGYSTEYQAILDEIDTQGWTEPSSAQKTAGDNFCTCLVDNNLWDEFDWLIVAVGVGDEDQAKGINWVDPTGSVINVTESGTITWNASTGFTTNGSSYLDMGWAPDDGTNFTQNDASFGVYTTDFTYPSANDYIMGSMDASSRSILGFRTFAAQERNYYSVNSASESAYFNDYSGSGRLFHVRRSASNAHRFSVDGTEDSFSTNTSATPNTYDFTLFAYSRLGSITGHVVSGVDIWMSFAGSNSGLDDGDLDTCWDSYMSDLGL